VNRAPPRSNLLEDIPGELPDELVSVLVRGAAVRIERIVSRGHTSPPDFWYDQDEHEVVFLLAGRARILFDGEWPREETLEPGDWLEIRAHERHRVTFTEPAENTIWLAVFYRA
jgi:cupin 2 domain-containing protein